MILMTDVTQSTSVFAMETVVVCSLLKTDKMSRNWHRLQSSTDSGTIRTFQVEGDSKDSASSSIAGPLKEETLSCWFTWPNPFHQSRPFPLGNESNSQDYVTKCQGLQTKTANQSQKGSHGRWSMSTPITEDARPNRRFCSRSYPRCGRWGAHQI